MFKKYFRSSKSYQESRDLPPGSAETSSFPSRGLTAAAPPRDARPSYISPNPSFYPTQVNPEASPIRPSYIQHTASAPYIPTSTHGYELSHASTLPTGNPSWGPTPKDPVYQESVTGFSVMSDVKRVPEYLPQEQMSSMSSRGIISSESVISSQGVVSSHGVVSSEGVTSSEVVISSAGVISTGDILSGRDVISAGISQNSIIIAVMGLTGAGKSSLIRNITGREDVRIGHGYRSETLEVKGHSTVLNGNNITLVDTPGFNDTYRTDEEVFKSIADWLANSYSDGQLLSGVIFLHRIDIPRVSGSALKSIRMLELLCGQDIYPNITLAMTGWEVLDESTIAAREKELCESDDFWRGMLSKGAKKMRLPKAGDAQRQLFMDMEFGPKISLEIQTSAVSDIDDIFAAAGLSQHLTGLKLDHDQQMESLQVKHDTQMENTEKKYDAERARLRADRERIEEQERMLKEKDRIIAEKEAQLTARIKEQMEKHQKDMEAEKQQPAKTFTEPGTPSAISPGISSLESKPLVLVGISEMKALIDGNWSGNFYYGERKPKNPDGSTSFTLSAQRKYGPLEELLIEGRGQDVPGDFRMHGWVKKVDKIWLTKITKQYPKHYWEYNGQVYVEDKLIRGWWGRGEYRGDFTFTKESTNPQPTTGTLVTQAQALAVANASAPIINSPPLAQQPGNFRREVSLEPTTYQEKMTSSVTQCRVQEGALMRAAKSGVLRIRVDLECRTLRGFCDVCFKSLGLDDYLVCSVCSTVGLACCKRCRAQGKWCFNDSHDMSWRKRDNLVQYPWLWQCQEARNPPGHFDDPAFGSRNCNACTKTVKGIYLHCCLCDNDNYDLCLTCVLAGKTCRNPSAHVLHEIWAPMYY